MRLFIEQHGDSRFDNVDEPDARPVLNRAGWRKGSGQIRRWLILPEAWKQEVCAGLDPQLVARTLADRGMLTKGHDGYQKVEKVLGQSMRFYVITSRIIDGSDE